MLYLRLITKSIFKKPLNCFFLFVIPILLTLIVCLVWNLIDLIDPQVIAPNISSISIISSSLCVLPSCIFNVRNSDLVNRLQSSRKSMVNFYITLALVFGIMQLIFYFFDFGLATLILYNEPTVANLWKTADWLQVIYSVVITILLSLTIGFVIGIFGKRYMTITAIGLVGLFISLILGFLIFPFQLEFTLKVTWLFDISYICPWHYTTALLNESWLQTPYFNSNHCSIFDLLNTFTSSPFKVADTVERLGFTCLTNVSQILDIFIPWIIIGGGLSSMWIYMKSSHYHHSISK